MSENCTPCTVSASVGRTPGTRCTCRITKKRSPPHEWMFFSFSFTKDTCSVLSLPPIKDGPQQYGSVVVGGFYRHYLVMQAGSSVVKCLHSACFFQTKRVSSATCAARVTTWNGPAPVKLALQVEPRGSLSSNTINTTQNKSNHDSMCSAQQPV